MELIPGIVLAHEDHEKEDVDKLNKTNTFRMQRLLLMLLMPRVRRDLFKTHEKYFQEKEKLKYASRI